MSSEIDVQPLRDLMSTIQMIRRFFEARNFQEIISPVLQPAVPLEPTIYPFTTIWHTWEGNRRFYLATSPENYLKKLLAMGIGNCFSIGHSFRDLEGAGPSHHPEFLMLEWYRTGANYIQIMSDVEELWHSMAAKRQLKFRGRSLSAETHFPRVSLAKEWYQLFGVDFAELLSDEKMTEFAAVKGYTTEHATWEQLFNQIVLNEIEPKFQFQPFFLVDFPAKLSPLCSQQQDKPYLAERFELMIGGIEIANGNSEETKAQKVKQAFIAEKNVRVSQEQLVPEFDSDFLVALQELENTPLAGCGLGVERLAMVLTDQESVHSFFPKSD